MQQNAKAQPVDLLLADIAFTEESARTERIKAERTKRFVQSFRKLIQTFGVTRLGLEFNAPGLQQLPGKATKLR